jgi:hypothetical protein
MPLGIALLTGTVLAVGNVSAAQGTTATTSGDTDGAAVVEHGRIVNWPGGDAVIYPTEGLFGDPQIIAVGAVHADGSFSVRLPSPLPEGLLQGGGTSSTGGSDQCATVALSDPHAQIVFTGNDLIFQHGQHIGNTHSGTSLGIASFTGFANGDTRTGFIYADRPTTLSGFCDRTITGNGATIAFRQNFDVPLHRGWNQTLATFSIPQPGTVVVDLTPGRNPAEKVFYFTGQ